LGIKHQIHGKVIFVLFIFFSLSSLYINLLRKGKINNKNKQRKKQRKSKQKIATVKIILYVRA